MNVGQRIADARHALDYTQERLAAAIGVHRCVIADIETGRRNVKVGELTEIAHELERPLEFFLTEATAPALSVAHRGRSSSVNTRKAQLRLRKRLEGCLLLRDVLEDVPGLTWAPPEFRGQSTVAAANAAAAQQRELLGLGNEPLEDVRATLEQGVGLPVFGEALDDEFLGMLLLSDDGEMAVMLINSATRRSRRNFTIAHEWGHLIWKLGRGEYSADFFFRDVIDNKEEEVFANAFAGQMLAPDAGVRGKFSVQGNIAALAKHTHALGSEFGVSYQAMTYRLQNTGLISPQDAQALRSHAEVWGCPANRHEWSGLVEMSPLFTYLVICGYQEGDMGEARCGELLGMTAVEFADMFEDATTALPQEGAAFAAC